MDTYRLYRRASIALLLLGFGLQMCHAWLQQRLAAAYRTRQAAIAVDHADATMMTTPTAGTVPRATAQAQYWQDLETLALLLRTQRVHVASTSYQRNEDPSQGPAVPLVDLQLEANYTQLRALLTALTNTLPHAAVKALQIERGNSTHRARLVLQLGRPAWIGADAPSNEATVYPLARQDRSAQPGQTAQFDPFGAEQIVTQRLPRRSVPAKPHSSVASVATTPATAPPLPFRLIGALHDAADAADADKHTVIFLALGARTLALRAGDNIGALYRVQQVLPDRVDFVYLPLNQLQSLARAP